MVEALGYNDHQPPVVQIRETLQNPAVDAPVSVLLGVFTGGIAGAIFGGPVGFLGGAAFGAAGGLAGSLTRSTINLICLPCTSVSPAVDSAVKVVSLALGIIASFAAGWALLTAMGIILPLGSVVALSLIEFGVGVAISLALVALIVACFCGCLCIGACVNATHR